MVAAGQDSPIPNPQPGHESGQVSAVTTKSDREVTPLDAENAKILRFIESFDAEIVERESIDVMQVNANNDGVIAPPF